MEKLLVYRGMIALGFTPRQSWAIRFSLYRFMAAVERIDGATILVDHRSVRYDKGYCFAVFTINGETVDLCWGTVRV